MCRKSKVQIFAAETELKSDVAYRVYSAYAETEYNGTRIVAVGTTLADAVTNLGYDLRKAQEAETQQPTIDSISVVTPDQPE